jgi:serine/threonine-protein kinase
MNDHLIDIPGFQVLSELGSGGMGTVYKARQLSLDRLVAIKTVSRDLTRDADYATHLQHEARIEATLKHTNIIQVHEAGQVADQYYFVMEYVSGPSLAATMEEQGRLSEREALEVIQAAASGLKYAWSKAGIVHGDLKPANMLRDEDGIVKLGDFLGVSKHVPASGAFADEILGTAHYMSPEQLLGEEGLDFRADIYSLGAVLYHLLSGRLPFAELAGETVHTRYLTSFLPDILDVAEVSQGAAWLLEKLLARDIAHRPASWAEVLEDIERVRKGGAPTPPYPHPGVSAMQRSPKRTLPDEEGAAPERSSVATQGEVIPLKRTRRVVVSPAAQAAASAARKEQPKTPPPRQKWILLGGLAILALLCLAMPFLPKPDTAIPEPLPDGEAIFTTTAEPADILTDDRPVVDEAEITEVITPLEPEILPTDDYAAEPTYEEPESDQPSQQKRATDLKAYTVLLQKIYTQVAAGEHTAARREVMKWLAQHPGSAYKQDARIQYQRVDMSAALYDLILSAADQFKGMPLGEGEAGEEVVSEVVAGRVWIKRAMGSGEAVTIVELSRLTDPQMFLLLEKADPHNAPRNKGVWLIAHGRIKEAEKELAAAERAGQDVRDLRTWIKERKTFDDNLAAYRALGEVIRLLKKEEVPQAKSKWSAASSAHWRSEVFRLNTPEVQSVSEAIKNIPSTPTPSTYGTAATTPSSYADTGTATPPKAEDDPSAIAVGELERDLLSRDGETLKLKFLYRGAIEFTGSRYTTTLHGESGSVSVTFPRLALTTLRNLPESSTGQPTYMYGTVDSDEGLIDLQGKRIQSYFGNKPRYAW